MGGIEVEFADTDLLLQPERKPAVISSNTGRKGVRTLRGCATLCCMFTVMLTSRDLRMFSVKRTPMRCPQMLRGMQVFLDEAPRVLDHELTAIAGG